jgi:hypothetical protein
MGVTGHWSALLQLDCFCNGTCSQARSKGLQEILSQVVTLLTSRHVTKRYMGPPNVALYIVRLLKVHLTNID